MDTCTYPAKSGTRGQLALSPQCGFSGGVEAGMERVGEDRQWRKLELIQRVAAEVWG